jgi:hypothetical protein
MTQVTARIRPNGSYSNYLAYGTFDDKMNFKRVGYPKDIFKPIYGQHWGDNRNHASYEYEVSFDVPDNFPYVIAQIGSGKQSHKDAPGIVYPLPATYYHGTNTGSIKNMAVYGIRRGTYVSPEFSMAVYYALPHFIEGAAIVTLSAQAVLPTNFTFDEERIVIGASLIESIYKPQFSSIPEDWMEPNDTMTAARYPELFAIDAWELSKQ